MYAHRTKIYNVTKYIVWMLNCIRESFLSRRTHIAVHMPYTYIKFVRQNICLSVRRRLLFATMADHVCVHQKDMCSPSEHIYVHQAFIYYICTQTVLKFATYPPMLIA